jgi:tagatose 1,6-diphosphate aldolase
VDRSEVDAFGITEGKRGGLQVVRDSRDVIAPLAIDQRGGLGKLFAQAMNTQAEKVAGEMLVQFKACVNRGLTPHASAILLDPEYGIPAETKGQDGRLASSIGKDGLRQKGSGTIAGVA